MDMKAGFVTSKLQSTKQNRLARPRDAKSLGNIKADGSGAKGKGVKTLQSSPITRFLEVRKAKFEGSRSGNALHAEIKNTTPSFGPALIVDDFFKPPSFGLDAPLSNYTRAPGPISNRNSEAETDIVTPRVSLPVISRKFVNSARRAFIKHASADRLMHLDSKQAVEATQVQVVDKPLRRRRKLSKKSPKRRKRSVAKHKRSPEETRPKVE
jgi:hypothetical protein